MPYDIQLPDGTLVDNIPDDINPKDAKARILQAYPELALGESRTIGETVTDVGASLGKGIGSLVQIPGQVAGLITGNVDETTGLQGLGKRLETFAEKAKSPVLKAKEQLRSQKIAEAEGPLAEAGVAISQTLTDPALITSFLFEQVPNLIGTMGGGLLTKGSVKLLMRNATEAALAKSGTRGAIGTGSIMQGADIGTNTYENVYNELISQGVDPAEASKEALVRGRTAAIQASAITVGTSFGAGSTIERALTRGAAGAPRRGIIRGTLGETLSEAVEEGGGQLVSNVQLQGVAPETDIMKGVGAAAGLGAVGGALFGLPASFVNNANANEIERARKQVEEAKRKAQEENKPQEVLLQIGYDPNVQGKVINTPIIVNPDGTTTFPSERNQFAQVVPDELSEAGMSEKYGIRTEEQIKQQTFNSETIKGLGISPKASLYRNKDILNADLADPTQADKVKGALEDYLKKYPKANPNIRKNVINYLLRQEFHRLPESEVPTQITEASITPEADQAVIQQRLSEGFRNRPEIQKIYDDYNKMMQEGDADKAALSAFNSIVTPQTIKSFGIPANSAIYGDQELINADLSNPETADRIRAKLMEIQKQTKSAKIKENIDKYLNRSEFITPTYVEQFLNPVREEGQENLDHFVFVNNEGEIESKYGTIVEKDGKKYAKYPDNKFQKGGDRELNENVLVNPKSPDQIELMTLYKAKDKLMKQPDDFKSWLIGKGVDPKERSDIGIESRLPHKMFRNGGFKLDDLVLMAIEEGILNEPDFQEGVGGVESMRNYIKMAVDGDFVPTSNNMRNMNDLENLQRSIEAFENRLQGVPEETIAQEFRGDETPATPPPTPTPTPTPLAAPISDEIQLYEYQLGINAAMMDAVPNPNIVSKAAVDKLIANKLVKQDPDGTLHLLPKGNALLADIREFTKFGQKAKSQEEQEALFAKYFEAPPAKQEISQTPYADKFIKDSKKLTKDIRAALDKMGLKDVGLKFEDAMRRRINGEMTAINGEYFDKMIELSLSGDNIFRTMNHEALHAMKDLGFFSDKEWKTLENKARSEWMKKYKIVDNYSKESEEVQLEEAIAHAFADAQTQPAPIKSIMSRAVNFLKRIGNWLRGNGYRTAEDIFGKAATGKLKKTKEAANKARSEVEKTNNVIDFNKFKADSEDAVARSRPMIMESLNAQLNELQKVYDQNLINDKDLNELREKFAKYDNDPLMAISAIKRKVNEVTKKPKFEKKMKASFEGIDEAYANAIRKQFTQEEATVVQKFNNLKSNFFEKMVTGVFDEFRAIRKYTTEGYMMARLSKSIDGGLQGLLEHGQVYIKDGALDIRPGTKGLLEILEPLGAEVDQYQIWKALSRDAQMSSDKRSFDADLVAGRDNLTKGTIDGKSRKEIYEKARSEENQLNRSVLDVALQSGLIDRQAYQVFSNDINYIPFYKMMEDGDVDSVNASSKLTGQYFSKSLKGGEKKTNDLMENVLLNWSHILSASMKNQAAVKTIKAAESMDAAVKAKPMDGKYPPNTIKVMEEGKTTHYTLEDPDLVDAISTISYLGPKSAFLDVAKGFTNALRYGITLSPAYKVRNLIRDSLQSAAISELGANMFNNVYNGLRMSSKGDPTFMAALAGGGIFEMGTAHEGNQAKLIKRLIDKGIRESTILDTPEKIKGKLQDLLDSYNELGNKFENANRLALYKKLIDSGKSHLEASYASRDLMDFSMQGQFRAIKVIGSVVPFFNARLQGLYKLGRDGITPTYRVICNATTGAELRIGDKEKAQRFMVMSSAISMASILLYGAYKDDEDFQRREGWDRDNFWWFKIGDTQFRIPKPFEIGAFGTIAERTYEQIVDDSVEGKVFGERLNHILMDTFSLNPMPQMIKPLIDLYANKDSFTSAPIESAGMERLSKQERVTNRTSGVAIALGGISEGASKILTFNPNAQGFSPVQMDYAIKAYLGWLGATAVDTADRAIEPFKEGTRVRPPVIDQLAMGFIKTEPQTQSKYMTQFYENNARLQSALADMRHYAELGDMDKVAKIMEEKGDDIALSKVYDKATKQLAELRKQSRRIEQMKDIPTDDKRAEMNRLKILMSDIAKEMESIRKSR